MLSGNHVSSLKHGRARMSFARDMHNPPTLPRVTFTASKLEVHQVIQDSTKPDLQPEARGEAFKPHGENVSVFYVIEAYRDTPLQRLLS